MATMNFYERAKKLGHSTDEKKLKEGVSTIIMVQSLDELKELLNGEGLTYTNFPTNESVNDITPESDLIQKVYQYIFGGEDRLMANDTEIIKGIFPIPVKAISLENEVIDRRVVIESASPVTYNYKTVTFKNKGYIDVINTELTYKADSIIIEGSIPSGISRINILGRDGANGQDGNNGADGANGTDGADDSVAHHGTPGLNGTSSGASGTNGHPGTGHNSTTIEILDSITGKLTVRTKSGKGGKGGNGGYGGKGGNGGHGGNVHKSTCTDITGGNGGNGGNGGAGSNGGNGGDSGNSSAPVIVKVPGQFITNVEARNEAPVGGQKGSLGTGGAAGKGNEGGYGNCEGRRGTYGIDGGKGDNGKEGQDGKPGTSSEIKVTE